MRAILAIALAAAALAGCGGEQCLLHSDADYARTLVKRLAAEGIKSEARKDKGGVCFAKRDAVKVAAVDEDLKKHFFGAGTYVADQCQEKTVVDWAKAAGLDYGVKEPAQHGGKRKGKIVYVYSLSAADVEANRKKLMEAPRGPKCPGGDAQ